MVTEHVAARYARSKFAAMGELPGASIRTCPLSKALGSMRCHELAKKIGPRQMPRADVPPKKRLLLQLGIRAGEFALAQESIVVRVELGKRRGLV
jgi:hypothetical protein